MYSRTLTHAGFAAEASLKRCETCSGHSIGVATPTPGRLAAAHHASGHSAVVPNASKHRDGAPGSQAAAPHAGQSAAARERPEGAFRPEAAALAASGHAVDPIEKSAPAWRLDPTAPPTHPSPSTPAQPESAYHLDSSSHAPAQPAHVTKSEPTAAVLPCLDQSNAAPPTVSPQQKPVTGPSHSLSSALAAGPAVQARSPLRPAAQLESAVDSSPRSNEPVASVSQVGTGSQAAGAAAGGEWQGFASIDDGQDDDSSADRGHDESAQATGQGMSSAYKVDAVAEARRLNEQQGSSGFHGFDVNSGRPTPDLIKGLPADTAMKAKQPSSEPSGERRGSGEAGGERRSSGEPNSERRVSGEKRISKGPLHDALGSGGYAAGSLAAANARRSSDLQRAPPSMQIPVPSPKLSGIAHQQNALCHSCLNLFAAGVVASHSFGFQKRGK